MQKNHAERIIIFASDYPTHAQLCIAGTVVQEYWDSGDVDGKPASLPADNSVMTGPQRPNNSLPSPTLSALFDSTHFLDSSMIVLTLKVWDSNGGYYDGAIQGVAKNKLKCSIFSFRGEEGAHADTPLRPLAFRP